MFPSLALLSTAHLSIAVSFPAHIENLSSFSNNKHTSVSINHFSVPIQLESTTINHMRIQAVEFNGKIRC